MVKAYGLDWSLRNSLHILLLIEHFGRLRFWVPENMLEKKIQSGEKSEAQISGSTLSVVSCTSTLSGLFFFVRRSWKGSRIFIPDNFNAEPRFRISSGEGRGLMVEYEFPRGNTKYRVGVKVTRNKNFQKCQIHLF